MSEWTDELRQAVIDEYLAANPTSENSVEIVAQLAEKHEKTSNGVRMVLSKAKVYIKKDPASGSSSTTKKEGSGTPRVSKADSIASLNAVIESAGLEVDEEIIGKLTGKAAVYFTTVITSIMESSED